MNAEQLRGTELFISNGSGLPGPHDNLNGPGIDGSVPMPANRIIVGGVIEAATDQCTHDLAGRLNALRIPATFDFTPTGTHSWGYSQDALHKSWPMIGASIGARASATIVAPEMPGTRNLRW